MRQVFVFFLGYILFACALQAEPVDLSAPSGTLGSASSEGYVFIIREIDEVDYGNGLKLPVRIQFKSQPGKNSAFLGSGWRIPMLECSSSLYREGMMKAELPCGKRLWLFSRKRGSPEYATLDQKWKGVVENRNFTVSRADGWQIKYVDGKLSSIRTDEGRLIQWIYDGKRITGISEGGNEALKVVLDPEGKFLGLSINGRNHRIEYGQRPRVAEISGQRLVEALEPTLVKWEFPGGRTENYNFSVDGERFPVLEITSGEAAENSYSWHPASGYIRSEGEWRYEVGAIKEKFELPVLSRTNSQGQREEISVDSRTGVIAKAEDGGSKTITYTFKAPGPLYNKVQKVEKVGPDGKVQALYTAHYNEMGQLIRETDSSGFTTIFTLDEKGKVLGQKRLKPHNESLLKELHAKEAVLLKAISEMAADADKNPKLQELGFFYIHAMGEPKKALALVGAMNDSQLIYNIKLHAASYNPNLSRLEKIENYKALLKEFPEKTEQLEWMIDKIQKKMVQQNK